MKKWTKARKPFWSETWDPKGKLVSLPRLFVFLFVFEATDIITLPETQPCQKLPSLKRDLFAESWPKWGFLGVVHSQTWPRVSLVVHCLSWPDESGFGNLQRRDHCALRRFWLGWGKRCYLESRLDGDSRWLCQGECRGAGQGHLLRM